ncbi:MAG: hypothetical protein KDC53_19725 [Saprospiraceae bacterium]|nr:hypothetical protein [Saprospiraceae bacterium]
MLKYITLIAFMFPLWSTAQTENLLPYGSNLIGDLPSPNDIDVYRFMGNAGDRVWIRVADAATNLDASFRLRYGTEVLYEIKGSGGDVELFDYLLADTGIYDLEIFDNNHNDAGAYGLSLQKLNNPSYAKQINCGDDIMDSVKTQVGIKVYQFAVEEGDHAFAQMRAKSAHFEANMYLFNEDGDLLKKSIRKANPYALIEDIVVDQNEQYALFVFDANGNDTSTFGITYQDLNDPSCGVASLSCKDHYQGKIHQLAETHAFKINLNAGDGFVAKVLATSYQMESSISVYDPSGAPIFQKIVSGKANDIVMPSVPLTGEYILLINDDRANDTSTYYLSYNKLDIQCAEELALCREHIDSFNTLADLNLYYFFTSAEPLQFEVKEIDASIEPYSSLIYNDTYQNAKDNVKLKIVTPDIGGGSLVFLALSDNGGNDLGRYRIRPVIQATFTPTPPIAIARQGVEFFLPASGELIISGEDLDQGSYDDCEIVEMIVSPNHFDCFSLGEQEVDFTVIDNEGLSSTISSSVIISSDLALTMETCMSLPVEEYLADECIEINGEATGGSGVYQFEWSNGTTGLTTSICPNEVKDLTVKLTDSNGCKDEQDLWIPIGENVLCHPNGKKVTICHYPPDNPNNQQELCVNIASLPEHFGHGDMMGPCNGPCTESEEVLAKTKSTSAHLIQLPGIIAEQGETLRMHLDELKISTGKAYLELVNSLGQSLFRNEIELVSDIIGIQLPDSKQSTGLYYLFVRQVHNGQAKQITLPIMLQ